MALVVWAAVLEARAPAPRLARVRAAGARRGCCARRRGCSPACTSCGWPRPRPGAQRVALRGAGRDRARSCGRRSTARVTGDPLFSLHYTSSSAEELGRQRTLAEIPSALPYVLRQPRQAAGAARRAGSGSAFALLAAPRRAAMPLVLLLSGIGTFVLIGIAGPVGHRALPDRRRAGAAGVRRRRARRLDDAAARARCGRRGRSCRRARRAGRRRSSPPRASTSRSFTNELQFRGDAHTVAGAACCDDPAVRAALRCGPLTAPNHKLVPDARWILDLPRDQVLARADPDVPRRRDRPRRRRST